MRILIIIFIFSTANFVASQDCRLDYTFTLWVGDSGEQRYFEHMFSPNGIHFIDAMNQAAVRRVDYQFSFIQYPFGKYITKIGNYAEDPAK